MANLSKTTKNREEIQRWAEDRGGKPAHVKTTESGEDIGILRIEFPGFGQSEGSLEPITWDEFFEKFGERDLALIYQEETAEGERSNFNKLVSSETAAESERGRKASRKRSVGAKKAQKTFSRSSSAKKSAVKKGSAKKAAPSKKTSAKKSPTKKSAAKKAAPKKAAAKKSVAKKSSAKRRR